MTKFYTSVERFGNQILYVGYENGVKVKRRDTYHPTLFVPVFHGKPTKYKTIDGVSVDTIRPGTMRDCKEFIDTHKTDNYQVYGNSDYVAQYISDEFPLPIEFDRKYVNVAYIDIEVQSDRGFPHPNEAAHEVTAITIKTTHDNLFVVFACGDFDPSDACVPESDLRYVRCENEYQLLKKFLTYWSKDHPDIVTGWNTQYFDIPYLVNRIAKILGEQELLRFSPHRISPNPRKDKTGEEYYEFFGFSQLDYLRLFKKFAGPAGYGMQESYKLNHIAHVVLGDRKLDYSEYGSLNNLYLEDHHKFIDYNIKDTLLIERLDEKLGLIDLVLTLSYKAKCNYEVAFGSTKIWDTFIYNVMKEKNIVLPNAPVVRNDRQIEGAYVKPPITGKHDWICSFDLNSLYPHLIMQYNMSPETVLNQVMAGVNVETMLKRTSFSIQPNTCVSATGQVFRTDIKGIFPEIIEKMYAERKDKKKKMLALQQQLEHIKDKNDPEYKVIERKAGLFHNEQHAIKILMNSLYGALSNTYFRYYDIRVAEAITISGQLSIRWAEKTVNDYLNKVLETDEDYVVAIDTDSIYVRLGPLVNKVNPKDPCEFLNKVCAQKLEPLIDDAYKELQEYTNAPQQKMVMKREVIASTAVWTGKKRYAANVLNNEGVQYAKPKLKITGIESVRSSTPQVCRGLIEKTIRMILEESEATVQQFIEKAREEFHKLPPEDVAFPRGVKGLDKYARKREGLYAKGTPIHVRAALLYNHKVRELGMENNFEMIRNDDKIKFLYLKEPNTLGENVIGFPFILPQEFGLHEFVDYDMQFDKTYVEPIRTIMEAIGWEVEKTNTLEAFF